MKDSLKYYYVVAHGKEETPVVIETVTHQEAMASEVYRMEQQREAGYISRPQVRKFFYIDWVSLGVYDFPAGKATVTLSDRGAPEEYDYCRCGEVGEINIFEIEKSGLCLSETRSLL